MALSKEQIRKCKEEGKDPWFEECFQGFSETTKADLRKRIKCIERIIYGRKQS